jgi:DNA polymerase III alpha subunit
MRVRSGYSFKTVYGHLKDVASRLSEVGWSHQPISDRASTFSFNRWSKTVKNPIYGVELAVVEDIEDKKASLDWWTFFAIKELQPLHALIGQATWYEVKEPSLTYQDMLAAKGVIKIAGEYAQLHNIKKPQKDMYVALSPATPIGLYKQAKKRGFKFIASCDNYYPRETDKETYRIALGRRSTTQTYPIHILSDPEWLAATEFASEKDQKEAIKNRNAVMKQCTAKMTKATLVIPERKETLRAMCETGAKRLGVDLNDPVYAQRLDRELKLIDEKEFGDYFYIIADIIQWSKQRMIVGPARGSSCGSLVCYLLDITTIDPIKFNLIFERFIDVNRNDLPDIDIDFSDLHRSEAFEYVEQKYGKARTARLGTVGMFRPRSAMIAAGKSLAIPAWRIEKVMDGLITRSLGDSRALQTLEDTLRETGPGREFLEEYPEALLATPMEGHPQNASQHAAGVIITNEAIDKYVAIDSRSQSAMCDKKDAEDLGMLKIDMLGLTQLSVFERTLELIGERPTIEFFTKLPLDDKKAFDVLNKKHYSGIFQFNGHALQSIAEQIKTEHIEDIIAMTALARPGPMASGGTTKWVQRKLGNEAVVYPHPLFEPYMSQTMGVVAYQEQVMQIGREIGDLSWDDVTQLRKAMSRSLGKEYFDQFGDRWKTNAVKKGVPQEVCDKTWEELCSYGSWAFNRAHAVAYGLVSYWCCWLKAYHPAQFAAATLDSEGDVVRQMLMLRELEREGISYIPVDPNLSTDRWNINDDGVLLGPLTSIKGIGSAAVLEIVNARETGKALKPGVAKKLGDPRTPLDSIYPVTDAIARLVPDWSAKFVSVPTPVVDIKPNGREYVVMAIGVVTKVAPKDENEAVNVAKRGGRRYETGPTQTLNFWIRDDTDEIFCKLDRFNYEGLGGKHIQDTSRVGRTLYAVKGIMPRNFRMIRVTAIKYIGEMDLEPTHAPERGGQATERAEYVDP